MPLASLPPILRGEPSAVLARPALADAAAKFYAWRDRDKAMGALVAENQAAGAYQVKVQTMPPEPVLVLTP